MRKAKLEALTANNNHMINKISKISNRESQTNLKKFNKDKMRSMTAQVQKKIKIVFNKIRKKERTFGKR